MLEIIHNEFIETQEELAERLAAEGFQVTQATISRDIKELRLSKVPTGEGRYRYAVPDEAGFRPLPSERLLRLLREYVTGWDDSENLVVIHTLPATAQAVAEALDGLDAREIIGTLAGERTVFVAIKPKEAVPAFLARLEALIR